MKVVLDLTGNKEANEFRFIVNEAQVRAAIAVYFLFSTRVVRGMAWMEQPISSPVNFTSLVGRAT
jgi:hypothetical protein